MSSIREQIKSIQIEVLQGDIPPARAAELLNTLSALIGNCNDEIVLRDNLYAIKLLDELDSEEKANRAKIKAEISEEYKNKMIARNTKELVMELIRSLKYYLRAKDSEYREGGQQ